MAIREDVQEAGRGHRPVEGQQIFCSTQLLAQRAEEEYPHLIQAGSVTRAYVHIVVACAQVDVDMWTGSHHRGGMLNYGVPSAKMNGPDGLDARSNAGRVESRQR